MVERFRRYSMAARVLGVMIILALLGVIGYYLYDFYSDKVGFTAEKAIEAYFNALAQGDYEEVYRLTATEHLTDIYGRPITKGEFVEQLKALTGKHRLPFSRVESTKLFERQGVRYYSVTLHSFVGGKAATSKLLVQMWRVDRSWVIKYPFIIVL